MGWGLQAHSLGRPPAELGDYLLKDMEAGKSEMYCGHSDAAGRGKLEKLEAGAR